MVYPAMANPPVEHTIAGSYVCGGMVLLSAKAIATAAA
jgi:hypothetical protein